ncbi:hypothetical protein GSI_13232 [Ganoderma sinense ZZ0214-1]|uniref:Uncharacterized protein n=1 Tax=Ganoderma sinense ZZ0214-1 TaxID=1077348 RepID=A0A2G8RV12_9APHY|nr:hypothetical protein GSI_13232 [Ganoderma sinense ZZ0214-1]
MWTLAGHPTQPEQDARPLVMLDLHPSPFALDWDERMPDGLDDLLAVFGFAPLTHLEVIGICAAVTADNWAAVFLAFPCLVSLRAGTEATLFEGLHTASLGSVEPPDNTTSHAQALACPGLERIHVVAYCTGLRRPAETVFEPLVECNYWTARRRGLG